MMLLLCHASPELHAISKAQQLANRRKRKEENNKANARIEHFHRKWIRVHERIKRRGLAWPAKRREAYAIDVVVVVERRVDVLLQRWLEGTTGDKVGDRHCVHWRNATECGAAATPERLCGEAWGSRGRQIFVRVWREQGRCRGRAPGCGSWRREGQWTRRG